MHKKITFTLMILAALLAAAEVVAQSESRQAGSDNIYFLASHFTPEMQGSEPGQVEASGAIFQEGTLYAVEAQARIVIYTESFSGSVKVWLNSAYRGALSVHFQDRRGAGLGECQTQPGENGWSACEHDPTGGYAVARIVVNLPQGVSLAAATAARPESWQPPAYFIFAPIIVKH